MGSATLQNYRCEELEASHASDWWLKRMLPRQEPNSFLRICEDDAAEEVMKEPVLVDQIVVLVPEGYKAHTSVIQRKVSMEQPDVELDLQAVPAWYNWHSVAVMRETNATRNRHAATTTYCPHMKAHSITSGASGWRQHMGPYEYCRIADATYHQRSGADITGGDGLFVRLKLQKVKVTCHQGQEMLQLLPLTCVVDYHSDGEAAFITKRSYFESHYLKPHTWAKHVTMLWPVVDKNSQYIGFEPFSAQLKFVRVPSASSTSTLTYTIQQPPESTSAQPPGDTSYQLSFRQAHTSVARNAFKPDPMPPGTYWSNPHLMYSHEMNPHVFHSPWNSAKVEWDDANKEEDEWDPGDQWVQPWDLKPEQQLGNDARAADSNPWMKVQENDWLGSCAVWSKQDMLRAGSAGNMISLYDHSITTKASTSAGVLLNLPAQHTSMQANNTRPSRVGLRLHKTMQVLRKKQKQKAEQPFCSSCLKFSQDTQDLVQCSGPCKRSFHPGCERTLSRHSRLLVWRCPECKSGRHACMVCGRSNTDVTLQCAERDCGHFFHLNCLLKISKHSVGFSTSFPICPAHHCCKCSYGEASSNQGPSHHLCVCWSCSRVFHRKCLPVECVVVPGHPGYLQCPTCSVLFKHQDKQEPHGRLGRVLALLASYQKELSGSKVDRSIQKTEAVPSTTTDRPRAGSVLSTRPLYEWGMYEILTMVAQIPGYLPSIVGNNAQQTNAIASNSSNPEQHHKPHGSSVALLEVPSDQAVSADDLAKIVLPTTGDTRKCACDKTEHQEASAAADALQQDEAAVSAPAIHPPCHAPLDDGLLEKQENYEAPSGNTPLPTITSPLPHTTNHQQASTSHYEGSQSLEQRETSNAMVPPAIEQQCQALLPLLPDKHKMVTPAVAGEKDAQQLQEGSQLHANVCKLRASSQLQQQQEHPPPQQQQQQQQQEQPQQQQLQQQSGCLLERSGLAPPGQHAPIRADIADTVKDVVADRPAAISPDTAPDVVQQARAAPTSAREGANIQVVHAHALKDAEHLSRQQIGDPVPSMGAGIDTPLARQTTANCSAELAVIARLHAVGQAQQAAVQIGPKLINEAAVSHIQSAAGVATNAQKGKQQASKGNVVLDDGAAISDTAGHGTAAMFEDVQPEVDVNNDQIPFNVIDKLEVPEQASAASKQMQEVGDEPQVTDTAEAELMLTDGIKQGLQPKPSVPHMRASLQVDSRDETVPAENGRLSTAQHPKGKRHKDGPAAVMDAPNSVKRQKLEAVASTASLSPGQASSTVAGGDDDGGGIASTSEANPQQESTVKPATFEGHHTPTSTKAVLEVKATAAVANCTEEQRRSASHVHLQLEGDSNVDASSSKKRKVTPEASAEKNSNTVPLRLAASSPKRYSPMPSPIAVLKSSKQRVGSSRTLTAHNRTGAAAFSAKQDVPPVVVIAASTSAELATLQNTKPMALGGVAAAVASRPSTPKATHTDRPKAAMTAPTATATIRGSSPTVSTAAVPTTTAATQIDRPMASTITATPTENGIKPQQHAKGHKTKDAKPGNQGSEPNLAKHTSGTSGSTSNSAKQKQDTAQASKALYEMSGHKGKSTLPSSFKKGTSSGDFWDVDVVPATVPVAGTATNAGRSRGSSPLLQQPGKADTKYATQHGRRSSHPGHHTPAGQATAIPNTPPHTLPVASRSNVVDLTIDEDTVAACAAGSKQAAMGSPDEPICIDSD